MARQLGVAVAGIVILLGRWNWWPSRLRGGVEEPVAAGAGVGVAEGVA